MIKRLWVHRDLVMSLVRRQYQLRYRQSAIGLVWAAVLPLATLAMATLVFDGVARIDTDRVSYPVFALSALAPWTLFASSLSTGVPSISSNQMMVSRLPFPRAALPLSAVGLSLLDLTVASAIFVLVAVATGHALSWVSIWFLPLVVVELIVTIGVVLLGSALNVFARDVRLMVPVAVQLLLFVTPVMYPLSSVPDQLRNFYLMNPMTGLAESFRRVLVYGQPPEAHLLIPTVVEGVILLIVGVWYFRATESRFADVL